MRAVHGHRAPFGLVRRGFKDFGEKGAKVDEGWGGVRDASMAGMMYFMTEESTSAIFVSFLTKSGAPLTTEEQRLMLEEEGVVFKSNGNVDMGRFRYDPGEKD